MEVDDADRTQFGLPGPDDHPGGATARATIEDPPVAVQHRRDRDPIAADQARRANNDLLIHPQEASEVGP